MVTLRVMVVDGEPGMCASVEQVLSTYKFVVAKMDGEPSVEGNQPKEIGLKVEQVHSGEEALQKIKAAAPDILLLDHTLPGLSGIEVLKRLPESAANMLTIMTTANASIETAVKAMRHGSYDFLPKPFTPQELKDVIRKACTQVLQSRRAKEKKRIRFGFIWLLVHELKAPLDAVSNYIDMLSGRALGEDLKRYGEVIERSQLRLKQMQKLTTDLLEMIKIESDVKIREIVDLDLTEVAVSSLELVELQAASRGIALNLQAPAKLPFRADRGEIEMILNNLVSNAVKYNRDNGCVDLSLSAHEGGVLIVVSDTGIGMNEAELKKLFGEFTRIKNDKTKNILGSGLGLSIIKKLVALYGGEVKVESVPDQGSTFRVVLRGPQAGILEET
ncbi:MAG: response regulator [Deltaproteobacteria bacterium]|nr:response regulator [Deltaproteobacteria bacterium]